MCQATGLGDTRHNRLFACVARVHVFLLEKQCTELSFGFTLNRGTQFLEHLACVQGDIMRQQLAQANANSRDYLPTSAAEGAPPSLLNDKSTPLGSLTSTSAAGTPVWNAGKARYSNAGNRAYTANPVVRRDAVREHVSSPGCGSGLWFEKILSV